MEPAASGDAAVVRFYNRDIVTFRSRVAGRSPSDRVDAALSRLYGVLDSGIEGEVVRRSLPAGVGLAYARTGAEAPLLLVTPLDIDTSLGATLEGEAQRTVEALAVAIGEYRALHDLREMSRATLRAAFATVLFLLALFALSAARRAVAQWLPGSRRHEAHDIRVEGYTLIESGRVAAMTSRVLSFATGLTGLAGTYVWLTFALRQFPYTRPWGDTPCSP